ncbi:cytochrome o ubiquinol oxidase subunit IV [Methylobacterium sp.]|uniref:cytochrome o ubiquinol oxidase subunit IV n=1 Tax=Methylobacterium sp. TaxID=409 RepID=UPI003B000E6A
MTLGGQYKGVVLLKAIAAAALFGVARVSIGAAKREPEHGAGACTGDDESHSKRSDLVNYGVGYLIALLLTGTAFAVVTWGWATGTTALTIVFGLALIQAVVHFRYFLHIDLRRSHRDDLQLILFSTLIVCLMVGGTLVVLLNLRMRMM